MGLTDRGLLETIDKARRGENERRVDKLVGALDAVDGVSDETLHELAELLVDRLWLQGSPIYWSNAKLWPALARLPERAFGALCHAMGELDGDFPDAQQAAATFLFSSFSARGKASLLTPTAKNMVIFRQRCRVMGELVFCPERPDAKDLGRLRKLARSFPELNAHVKATVLANLDSLQTSRSVDRALVLWLATNGVDGAPKKKAPKKKASAKKASAKKPAKKKKR